MGAITKSRGVSPKGEAYTDWEYNGWTDRVPDGNKPIPIDVCDMRYVPFSRRGDLPRKPGIYFVCHGDKILYIGRARDLRARWVRHHRTPQLAPIHHELTIHYWIADCWGPLLDIRECMAIEYYKPLINKTPAIDGAASSFKDLESENEYLRAMVLKLLGVR